MNSLLQSPWSDRWPTERLRHRPCRRDDGVRLRKGAEVRLRRGGYRCRRNREVGTHRFAGRHRESVCAADTEVARDPARIIANELGA